MKRQDVIDFLGFRKKFTNREWSDLNQAVLLQLNAKADKLQLDDSDIDSLLKHFEQFKILPTE